jgi:hypothetical protein
LALMSAIAGILRLDGAPVEEAMLQAMTASLAHRGPAAQEYWLDGPVGLAQAMLRVTWEQERERQPCSLDGRVWIAADARIDDRDSLQRALIARGRANVAGATGAELDFFADVVKKIPVRRVPDHDGSGQANEHCDRIIGDFQSLMAPALSDRANGRGH